MFLRKPLQFLFCLCLFATQCSGLDKTAAAPSKSKNEDERITKINITDLDGHPVDMKAFAGKPVFMNFWATWCGPCKSEMRSIETAYKQFNNDIIFLAASNESNGEIRSFQKNNGYSFTFVHLEGTYLDVYVTALPTTLLFDSNGQLVAEEVGFRDWSDRGSMEQLKSLIHK